MVQRPKPGEFGRRRVDNVTMPRKLSSDEALRSYLLKVFNYMFLALLWGGGVAYAVALSDSLRELVWNTPMAWVVAFGPFLMSLALTWNGNMLRMSSGAAQICFWIFATLVGACFSLAVMHFTEASLARAFLIAAISFGVMAIFGYTTKMDLSSWGSFLFIGMIAVILALFTNIFLQSSMINWVFSVVGALVFTCFTAYDVQWIKNEFDAGDGEELLERKAVFGALHLYINLTNVMWFLLRLIGVEDEF